MLVPSLLPTMLFSGESPPTEYNGIRAYGDATLDEWQFRKIVVANSILFTHGDSGRPPWDINTMLLMPFENNFDAGNFPTNDKPVTHWRILRRIYGTTLFYQLAIIPANSYNIFYDTTVASATKYEYAVQSVSNGTRGNALITQPVGDDGEPIEVITVTWYGWKLTSLDYDPNTNTGTIYSFIADNEAGDITRNTAKTTYVQNYSKYPKFEQGKANYRTGTLRTRPTMELGGVCVIGNNLQREQLEAFLVNGEPKILKNGSGLTMKVVTEDVSISYDRLMHNPDGTQVYAINFSFTEIGELIP